MASTGMRQRQLFFAVHEHALGGDGRHVEAPGGARSGVGDLIGVGRAYVDGHVPRARQRLGSTEVVEVPVRQQDGARRDLEAGDKAYDLGGLVAGVHDKSVVRRAPGRSSWPAAGRA